MDTVLQNVSELNLVLLGPPGAGKGTQAAKLQKDFSLAYLSTGNMLREATADPDNELGRQAKSYMDDGKLVPDSLVIEMLLQAIEAQAGEGFLLDGFPRTIPQAEALDEALAASDRRLTAVLLMDVPDEEVVRRISGRRQTRDGRHIYNIYDNPPKHEGFCDITGQPLHQREDDTEEVVQNRLKVYHEQTEPLVGFYEGRGILRRFDGRRSPTEVHDHVRATLATLRLEERL